MREQRRHWRTAADHDVVIYSQGRQAFSGKIRNVSRQGVYVVVGAFATDASSVEVQFSLPKDHPHYSQRLSATVIHRYHNGIGLRIDLAQAEAAERLDDLVALCQEFESHDG